MKRYCKKIDITDRKLISKAAYTCLEGKLKRNDTLRLIANECKMTPEQIYCIIYRYGKEAVYPMVERIIDRIRSEIISRKLDLPPIWYKEKVDPSSGKIRRIGIQNVKQQIYDYIAVIALQPIFGRIGRHQYASIKGRGPLKGARRILRWMRNKAIRYAGKADIKKCYESIDQNKLMGFLEKYIANAPLIWLIKELISTFEKGLSIGSYLSQHLCNLYLSQLYHAISEDMYRIRKHRNGVRERINLVKHVLLYMDDIYIAGANAKDLHKAMKLIISKAKEMGFEIKESWCVFRCSGQKEFVDMMGYRIYRDHMTIRRRVFKRVRRAYLRAARKISSHKKISVNLARRVMSYKGQLKNSNSKYAEQKYKSKGVSKICRRIVSNYDSTIFGRTATC